jgi:hypothetical protein
MNVFLYNAKTTLKLQSYFETEVCAQSTGCKASAKFYVADNSEMDQSRHKSLLSFVSR